VSFLAVCVFEVEAGETYALCTELVCEERSTVAVREATEVVQDTERACLCRADGVFVLKTGQVSPHRLDVVPVSVHRDDGAFLRESRSMRRCSVEVRDDHIDLHAGFVEAFGGCVCGYGDTSRGGCDLPGFERRGVPDDYGFSAVEQSFQASRVERSKAAVQ
jgi:hypothetical protein